MLSYEIAEKIIAVAMDKYSNSEVIKKKIQSSYEWVKKLEWNEVCKIWVNYFKEIL
jgi:hypothetical protein